MPNPVELAIPSVIQTPMLACVQEGGFEREARAAATDAAADQPRRYRVVITTTNPRRTWMGLESLDHSAKAVDLSLAKRGISAYLEHGGPDLNNPRPELHIGIVEDIELDSERGQTTGWLRFSRHALAQQAEQDVQDGTRIWVSGSYIPIHAIETKPATNDKPREYTVDRWQLVECGLVGIPADSKAVIKRSAGGTEYPLTIESATAEPATQEEESTMPTPANEATTVTPATPAAAAPEGRAARSLDGGGGSPQITDRNDVARIVELCTSHGLADRAPEYLRRGLTVEQVGLEILDARGNAAAKMPPPTSAEELGLTKRERRSFSFARAVQQHVELREGRRAKFDGLEGEVHEAMEKLTPANVQRRGGILVPWRMEKAESEPRERRALGTTVSTGGAELVFDKPGDLIEMLINRALVTQFGAQVYTGLQNTIPFPSETGMPTVQWMAENPGAGATASQPNFGTVLLNPKTMIGTVPIPRQLINLSSIDIEGRVQRRLVDGHALAMDLAALHGPGNLNQATGIYATSNVSAVAMGGNPTYGKLIDMQGAVENNNVDSTNCAYMTTPLMKARLKQTQVATGTNGVFIWTGGVIGEIAGYKAGATKQVSSTLSGISNGAGTEHGIVFGDWSNVALGFWGALEIVTDVVTLADRGQIKVTTFQMGDIAVLRPQAFCVSTGATA